MIQDALCIETKTPIPKIMAITSFFRPRLCPKSNTAVRKLRNSPFSYSLGKKPFALTISIYAIRAEVNLKNSWKKKNCTTATITDKKPKTNNNFSKSNRFFLFK